jgi:hypothetical protein
VTDPTAGHDPYDELAAGFALHALDPADQRQFLAHVTDCDRCQAAVGDYTEVTAALAESRPAALDPSPQLGRRIMAAIADEPQQLSRPRGTAAPSADGAVRPAGTADPDGADGADGTLRPPRAVGDLAARRNRHRRPRSRTAALAGAAAAVVIAAGGIWGGLAATGGGASGGTASVAGCAQPHACRQVLLTSATSQASARVVIKGNVAWLIPSRLPADNSTEQVYVLWQITGARKALPVGSFDVRAHRGAAVRIGPLDAGYHATRAFAISLEPGRAIPAKPSHTVALGQVAA